MKTRTVLVIGAIVLAAGAVVVEHLVRSEFSRARPGLAVADAAAERSEPPRQGAPAQDFALLELAVDTTPDPYEPYAFVVDVRDAAGNAVRRVLEMSENGVALFGPLAPRVDVRVAVVAGGERYGFDGEGEVLGEATIAIGPRGGRHFLVVPTHASHVAETRHRILVLDDEGWPVVGARVSVSGAAGEVETTAHGCCSIERTGGTEEIEVVPPRDRPDLDPVRCTEDMERPSGQVTLHVQYRRDVEVERLAQDCRKASVDFVWLRAADARSWVRRWSVGPGGRLASVPLGHYFVNWDCGGARREGRLSVGADLVGVDIVEESAPSVSLLVDGIPDPMQSDSEERLVIVERSERSCALPAHVLDTLAYEAMAGCGTSCWFAIAQPDAVGTLRFEGVPPGRYEIRMRRRPRWLSHCVEVPAGARGTIRVSPDFEPRDGTIHGTVRGQRQRKTWTVEARIVGEFSKSSHLHVGDAYELPGLAPGIYSVWASREDWGPQPLRGEPLPESPWKNVVVGAGTNVTLDFEVQ